MSGADAERTNGVTEPRTGVTHVTEEQRSALGCTRDASSLECRATFAAGCQPPQAVSACYQSSPGIIRFMNSSKEGTVKAVSPRLGLRIIPLPINFERMGPGDVTFRSQDRSDHEGVPAFAVLSLSDAPAVEKNRR